MNLPFAEGRYAFSVPAGNCNSWLGICKKLAKHATARFDVETVFTFRAGLSSAKETVRLHRVLPCLVALMALMFIVGAPMLAGEKDKKETHEGLVVKAGNGKLIMTDMEGKKEHTHM